MRAVDHEKERIKKQLEHELKHITFTNQQKVLARTHPVTRKEKLMALWNKEVEIPLLPVGTVLTLLFLAWGISTFDIEQKTVLAERELVEVGGNTYWKDELEKVVVFHED
jgi:hypothetical protein